MYATEFDLMVAEDHCRDRRNEMKAIRIAQAAGAETTLHPSLLDRLMVVTARVTHIQAPHRKVGAAA